MSYMAVLSAALAIRRGAHIRMTAFDVYLPKIAVKVLDILADLAVCILGLIMLVVGWNYATTLGGRGFYVSMPWLSRFWMYFPVPLAGVAIALRDDVLRTLPECREVQLADCRTSLAGTLLDSVLRLLSPLM